MTEKPEKPDIEFFVVLRPHSDAGRMWIKDHIISKDELWEGVAVAPWRADHLGDQAVADGLWISGFVPPLGTSGQ